MAFSPGLNLELGDNQRTLNSIQPFCWFGFPRAETTIYTSEQQTFSPLDYLRQTSETYLLMNYISVQRSAAGLSDAEDVMHTCKILYAA